MIVFNADSDQVDAEQPDHELVWNIHLLSQVQFNYSVLRTYTSIF